MSHSITDSTVLLGHGSGGQMMKRIIDEVFLDAFGSPELLEGNDAGVTALPASGRIAMSTDSFVVSPQFFPGGNIGKLVDGDIIEIDIPNRTINVRLTDAELAARPMTPVTRNREVSKALKAYASLVSSADKGAVRII